MQIWYKYFLELFFRFILVILSWFSVLMVSYFYRKVLLNMFLDSNEFLILNFYNFKPYFILTNITEIFQVYVYLILFLGNQVLFIYFIYHAVSFLSKGVDKKESLFLNNLFKIVLSFWFLSFIILNGLVLPITWKFFLSFYNDTDLNSLTIFFELKLIEYTKFYFSLYNTSFFISQFIALVFFSLKSLKSSSNDIRAYRKIYYLIFVVLSSFFTPPADIINQSLMSLVFIFFFEFFVFLKFFILVREPVETNHNSYS